MDADESRQRIRAHLLASADVKRLVVETCTDAIVAASQTIVSALGRGGKLMLCGNGGSAADSQHIAAEFSSGLKPELNRRALAAIALTTDTSFLTAHANDFSYAYIFARQVEALGHDADVLLAISTSGNSENVVRAVEACRRRGIQTIGLLGGHGGRLRSLVGLPLIVPSSDTQHIQEAHIAIGHVIADLVASALDERWLGTTPMMHGQVHPLHV